MSATEKPEIVPESIAGERLLLSLIYFVAVGLFALRVTSWFVFPAMLDAWFHGIFVFLLMPLLVFWCAVNIRHARRTGHVTVRTGPWNSHAVKSEDPTLYLLYVGMYWCASIMFVLFWIGFVTGIIKLG